MTPAQFAIQSAIEHHLDCIERIIGHGYKITIVARYAPKDGLDKDIVLTMDEADLACATIQKMVKRTPLGHEVKN